MRDGQKSCDKCGSREQPFIETYWDPTLSVCVSCCFELNRQFDANDTWPEHPDDDEPIEEADRYAYRVGLTLMGIPHVVDRLAQPTEF